MKQRIISAFVMVLIFVPLLIVGEIPFAILVALLGVLALKELLDLEKDIPMSLKMVALFTGLFLILYNYREPDFTYIIDYHIIGLLFLLSALSIVIIGNLKKYNYKDALWLMTIVLIVGVLFSNVIHLRNISLFMVIYVFLIASVTDTFALFSGMLLGRHKLSPKISPNKTIEGSIGGSLFGTIISVIFYLFFVSKSVNIILLIIVSFTLTIIGQLGDLFFSSIKRHYGVKDFSHLIPGHGGILDRFDSVLFVTYGYLILTLIL